jgi:DNA-binding NarL/FixJ family response regulator
LQDPDTRSRKRRAFIADDAPDVRESLALLLEHEGFVVVGTANTEYEAVDWVLRNPGGWDLAIVDLLLQDGSGFNVLRHFKASDRPGRVVVYSGFVTDVIRAQCQKLGADAVISKTDVLQLQQVLDAFRPLGDPSS